MSPDEAAGLITLAGMAALADGDPIPYWLTPAGMATVDPAEAVADIRTAAAESWVPRRRGTAARDYGDAVAAEADSLTAAVLVQADPGCPPAEGEAARAAVATAVAARDAAAHRLYGHSMPDRVLAAASVVLGPGWLPPTTSPVPAPWPSVRTAGGAR